MCPHGWRTKVRAPQLLTRRGQDVRAEFISLQQRALLVANPNEWKKSRRDIRLSAGRLTVPGTIERVLWSCSSSVRRRRRFFVLAVEIPSVRRAAGARA